MCSIEKSPLNGSTAWSANENSSFYLTGTFAVKCNNLNENPSGQLRKCATVVLCFVLYHFVLLFHIHYYYQLMHYSKTLASEGLQCFRDYAVCRLPWWIQSKYEGWQTHCYTDTERKSISAEAHSHLVVVLMAKCVTRSRYAVINKQCHKKGPFIFTAQRFKLCNKNKYSAFHQGYNISIFSE